MRDTVEQEEASDADGDKDEADQPGGRNLRTDDRRDLSEMETVADRLVELRLSLDKKLTYLAKHILAEQSDGTEHATFVTVGSLSYDGYLTNEQARTLTRLLMLSSPELTTDDAVSFLDDASRVVANLRATVFQSLVEKVATECGWERLDVIRKPARRVIVMKKVDAELSLIPVWTVGSNRKRVQTTRKRLGPNAGNNKIIVVPNQSTASFSPPPRVVRIGELPTVLAD